MSKGTDIFVRDADVDWESVGPGVRRKILTWDEGVMMVRVAFEAGATGTPHSHPHVQCTLVESGAFDVTIAGRTQRLTAGDSFIAPPNAVHGVVCVEAGGLLDAFTPHRQDFVKG
ncbi:cupin domain-containing protein [Alsobacter sp. SYSU M60028]|uniref:Cupin domain-containing protein n=1 Tax=Alsobacter ponti TaxID=2962936 RepID=A0ABT1LGM1_9HYPH|nr:cupin domain-containing protein [Alsobacter ponti]MCP8940647.1 cupin domain-containing protein [Alsobacter ponti]